MSVVATRVYSDQIVVASDSIRVHGSTQQRVHQSKLWRVGDITVGSCGYADETGLLRIFLATHRPKEPTEDALITLMNEFQLWLYKRTDDRSIKPNNSMHIVFGGKAFEMQGFYVSEIKEYGAIGAGEDFALAALYLGQDPLKAVETACEHSVYCERPVQHFVIRL